MWESSVRCDPFISFSDKKYSKANIVYGELKTQISDILSAFNNGENDEGKIVEDESEGLQPTM